MREHESFRCPTGHDEVDPTARRVWYRRRKRPTTDLVPDMAVSQSDGPPFQRRGSLTREALCLLLLIVSVSTKSVVLAFTPAVTTITHQQKQETSKGMPLVVYDVMKETKQHTQWHELSKKRRSCSSIGPDVSSNNPDKDLPPWDNESSFDETTEKNSALQQKLQWLEYTLLAQEHWALSDVRNLQQTMYNLAYVDADGGGALVLLGMLDFLTVLLKNTVSNDPHGNAAATDSTASPFVTKEILLAAVWHYAESVAAREQGVLDTEFLRRNILFGSTLLSSNTKPHPLRGRGGKLIATATSAASSQKIIPILRSSYDGSFDDSSQLVLPFQSRPWAATHLQISATDTFAPKEQNSIDDTGNVASFNHDRNAFSSNYEVWKIARGAAQIKRAEVLARAVESNGNNRNDNETKSKADFTQTVATLTSEEASRIRGLMLTVDGFDWRSLMIRCVACLYRLEGILESSSDDCDSSAPGLRRSPEVIRTAREGIRVFATLAQQLGLHSLKNRIEDRAFCILYDRQYRAVTALYHTDSKTSASGGLSTSFLRKHAKISNDNVSLNQRAVPMEAMSSFLQSQVAATLLDDGDLMAQLSDLQVQSRVKEKFSFWKKLVSKRFEKRRMSSTSSHHEVTEEVTSTEVGDVSIKRGPVPEFNETDAASLSLSPLASPVSPSSLSSLLSDYVMDAVALRVVLRARKWYIDEPEETIRKRERLLCYYVEQKLRSQWPATNPARIKDYIQFPKPNGK